MDIRSNFYDQYGEYMHRTEDYDRRVSFKHSIVHNTFVTTKRMPPEEFKNDKKPLFIDFEFEETIFGKMLVAAHYLGICYMGFCEDEKKAISILENLYPNGFFSRNGGIIHKHAVAILQKTKDTLPHVPICVRGTEFQWKVWDALLTIPMGTLVTYNNIALQIGNPKASRAVGSAVGSNPVSFLIPCHRVIKKTGNIGGYLWGSEKKNTLIQWEQSIKHENHN